MRFNLWDAREQLCEIGKRLRLKNFVVSNDGNLSCRLDEDRILATPTRISKGFMNPDDLVIVDPEGKQIGGHKKPTSELKLHLEVYRKRPDISAVVHAHPPHATAFAIARTDLPKCVLPEVEIFLGQIPITDYATPGSAEFAKTVDPYIRDHYAFILASHGALTLGEEPFDAYYKMETLDQYCNILMLARQIGEWKTLDYKSMQELFKVKERMGIPEPRANLSSPEDICSPGVCTTAPDDRKKDEGEKVLDRETLESIILEILKQKEL